MRYEIRVLGHLSPQWVEWFSNLTVENKEHGEGVLTARVTDRAALFGILNQIQALNLTLTAVTPLPDSPPAADPDSPLGE